MKSNLIFWASSLASLGAAQSLDIVYDPTAAKCTRVTLPVYASTENRVLLNPPADLYSNITAIWEFMTQQNGDAPVSGNYVLKAQYCTPAKKHANGRNNLLVFAHGNTYDSSYFGGLNGDPIKPGSALLPYSWVDYATKQGYYTLSVDRLGSGRSEHPEPVKEVQASLQAEVLHSLIQQYTKRSFDKITYVGHSFGSVIGTIMASRYPGTIDSYVLTGIAKEKLGDDPLPRQLAAVHMQATDYDPIRFPKETYTPGYLVPTIPQAREDTFYSIPGTDFDPSISQRDFDLKDTITLGEAATQAKLPAAGFTGSVFITTGRTDAVFCGNGTRTEADCGSAKGNQLTAFIAEFFPNASRKGSFIQEGAGHCALLHYSWLEGVKAVHKWLDGPVLPGPLRK